ncbi:hypothetical protein LPJ59_005681, partial [Coemansia sp. RSA 2399]
MDQADTQQEHQADQPPEVVPGQQIPELNTLNPPLNHRAQGNLERTERSGFSSPEGQQFHNEENVEGDDVLGLGGDYGGNEESEESADGSTDDETGDEVDHLIARNSGPYTIDDSNSPLLVYPEVNSLGPLTISDDAPDPQAGFLRSQIERESFSDREEEYIAINTQSSPRIHRRAVPSPTANISRVPITIESSSSSSSNQNGRTTATGSAAEKRRHSRRESATNRSQLGSNKRRRQSMLSAIAEDGEVSAGATASTITTTTAAVAAAAASQPAKPSDNNHGPRPRIMFKCAVCLDIPDPAVFIHPCGHIFCEGCAQGAAQTTRRCPVCRHHMRPRDIRVLQFRIAMHGRRRQAAKEPTIDEKEQSRQRVEKYCALNDKVMQNKAQGVCTHEALEATQRLLEHNTELHTVWNYRREIIVHLDEWQDAEKRQALLERELAFLLEILVKNIKSYWMWFHRVWAL